MTISYNHFRITGKLISKDLKEYDDMRNCEVNDFRWKIKAFANNLAQINTIQIVCHDKMRLLSFSSFSYYFGRVIKKSFDKCFKISF